MMNPTLVFDREQIEAFADHICKFSLTALKQQEKLFATEDTEGSEKNKPFQVHLNP